MYKTFNLHKNADDHDFETLGDALTYFAEQAPIKVLSRTQVLADGHTAGKDTMVRDVITIGKFRLMDNDPLYGDMPDDVIAIENQTAYNKPL